MLKQFDPVMPLTARKCRCGTPPHRPAFSRGGKRRLAGSSPLRIFCAGRGIVMSALYGDRNEWVFLYGGTMEVQRYIGFILGFIYRRASVCQVRQCIMYMGVYSEDTHLNLSLTKGSNG